MNTYDIKLQDSKITFSLNLKKQLIIRVTLNKQPHKILEGKFNNESLPQVIKRKNILIQQYFEDLRLDANEEDFLLVLSDVQSKLIIKTWQNKKQVDCEWKLNQVEIYNETKRSEQSIPKPAKQIGIVVVDTKQIEELKKMEQKQKELDLKMIEMEKQLKRKIEIRNKNLQKIIDFNQEKALSQMQLIEVLQLLQQTKKKYVPNPIQNSPKFSKFIEQENGKKKLFMRQKQVDDFTIQEIISFDLTKIQILSLGDNRITDHGFNLLFQKNQWPILCSIFLQNNRIENIHSLNKVDGLQTLVLYQNPLSYQSCQYLCQYWWPYIKIIRLSFKQGINSKCWQTILKNLNQKFPNLQQLHYSKKQDISQAVTQQILAYCNSKNISLNHSLNKEQLQKLIALQFVSNLVVQNLAK